MIHAEEALKISSKNAEEITERQVPILLVEVEKAIANAITDGRTSCTVDVGTYRKATEEKIFIYCNKLGYSTGYVSNLTMRIWWSKKESG